MPDSATEFKDRRNKQNDENALKASGLLLGLF